jgi:hypothetical protein
VRWSHRFLCYRHDLLVSENTLEVKAPGRSGPPGPARAARAGAGPWQLVRQYAWWLVGIAVVVVSFALIRVTNTRPGYDPYGWLVWGHQTWHLNLNLGGAPSWKPLPYFFTVPYALFGHYELWLWMLTAVAISLSGVIFAGRIAYQLVGVEDGDRRPAWIAAVFAGGALLGIESYMHFILSFQSDTMIVSLCLGSIDQALAGRPRWALAIGTLACLGRPEAWAWLGPWGVWMWFKEPALRKWLIASCAFILFMWFGVPTITNHRPLLAEQLALRSPRELKQNKIVGTIHRFTGNQWLPVQLAALYATIVAFWRRNWTVLILAAAVVVWVIVETILVLRGLPGVPRYLFEPTAVMTVLAGVGLGWIIRDALRADWRVPKWAGIAVVGAVFLIMVPAGVSRLRDEHKDLRHERGRTKVINMLQTAVNRFGGYKHIVYCGEPVTNVEYVSILAWDTKLNVGSVGYLPKREIKHGYPIVLFTQLPNGWLADPIHTAPSRTAACANVNSFWIDTPAHPNGALYPHHG